MHARLAALSLVCVLLVAAVGLADDTAPLAVLMSRQGEVRLVRGGGQAAAQFGTPLQAGDEIRTGPNSAADILFAEGHSIHLGAGSSLTVQAPRGAGSGQAAAAGGGKGDFRAVERFFKLKDSRGTSTLATLRSASAPAALEPLGPCQTRVREARPLFRWRASRPLGALKLTVYSEGGVHWQADLAEGEELAYPADAPPLELGVRYSWTVETTDPLLFPPVRSRACFFEIISDAERNEVTAALAAPAGTDLSPAALSLLRAGVLYDHGLLDEAIDATRAALATDAPDPDLRSILARLYVETGRVSEAVAEYDQLIEPR